MSRPHPGSGGGALPALVADVGGTNTRIALACGHRLQKHSLRRYLNSNFSSLEAVFGRYADDIECRRLAGSCIAVAGPVADGRGQLTHIDWQADAAALSVLLNGSPVVIINDLQAVGHALHHLHHDEIQPVVTGQTADSSATRLVINVGTGFNAVAVHTLISGRVVAPSECGHAGLPASAVRDPRLMRHLERTVGFVTIEDLLSGRGAARARRWVADAIAGPCSTDRKEAAFQQVMATALGSVAGDLALIHLPYGGIYLTGGVASAVAPGLAAHGFCEAFREKGEFASFMERFPISLITEDTCALRGCAARFFGL